MARYNVKHPVTGKWAMFSSVSDMFITDWMEKEEYEAWRKKHLYNDSEFGYAPAEHCNMADYHECVIDYLNSENGLTCFDVEALARERGKWFDDSAK